MKAPIPAPWLLFDGFIYFPVSASILGAVAVARVCVYLPDQIVEWLEQRMGSGRSAALRRYVLEKLSEEQEPVSILAKAELLKEG